MKYASIILVHYSMVDDYGGKKANPSFHKPGDPISRSKMLRQVVDSIVKNTEYPTELIIMDNGGNPDDSKYILSLVKKGIVTTYVRYANNMQYAFAYNQGAELATGDYLCFTNNDVSFKSKWLSTCIDILEKYPDRKFVASPFICSHPQDKYQWKELDGNRVNPFAGSNCMIMTREVFKKLGRFVVSGSFANYWFISKIRKGYPTIVPSKDLAIHLGHLGGLNWRKRVKIVKTLLNNKEISFDERFNNKKISNI